MLLHPHALSHPNQPPDETFTTYSVADPAAGWRPEKHEIYATAFGSHLFMTYFYMAGGGGL